MRLRYQIFLTLVCVCAVLIGIMFAVNSWSFSRGFQNYLNRVQLERLSLLTDALATHYERHQGWHRLQDNKREWRNLVLSNTGQTGLPSMGPPPRPGDHRPRGRPVGRIYLADTHKNLLIGEERMPGALHWHPINNADGLIGYLGVPRRNDLLNELDKVFSLQQQRSFAYAAVVMVIVSALLAMLLSDRLVRPLLKLQSAVRQISGGQYEHRVRMHRRDELGDLARDINQLALSLEKNLKARQQWLAEISHELRTPVAVLRSEIEAIQDGVVPLDGTAIDSLHTEMLRLSRLINDLHQLALSDVGSLAYRKVQFDVVSLIKERLQAHDNEIQAKALRVAFDAAGMHITLYADRDRMVQLVDNLLQNSIRYTDLSGCIRIAVHEREARLVIDWEDSSPGVSIEQLPRLFEPLYRADTSRSRKLGGSGLGLSIVQKIVLAHQGKIQASASDLGGVRVNITVPKVSL